jgi:major membrane immunogen (membrane-anchored lipoprotein)
MKNQIRMKILLTFILISLTFLKSQGQNEKVVEFFGYKYAQYNRPVQMPNGEYEPMHSNFDDTYERGRIIINEQDKTFNVKWLRGEDWVCKYNKKESRNETDEWLGEIHVTIYSGKWVDENHEALIAITKTPNGRCIITLRSRKVIDEEYDIDTWSRVFTFITFGDCF